jgi:hypothetical protein
LNLDSPIIVDANLTTPLNKVYLCHAIIDIYLLSASGIPVHGCTGVCAGGKEVLMRYRGEHILELRSGIEIGNGIGSEAEKDGESRRK